MLLLEQQGEEGSKAAAPAKALIPKAVDADDEDEPESESSSDDDDDDEVGGKGAVDGRLCLHTLRRWKLSNVMIRF